jgi:putative zinc finger/helix-turn-helix YgiT family protein
MRWTEGPLVEQFREGAFEVPGFAHERCDACGETLVPADRLEEVERAAVAIARADLGRLSSDEIHQLRHDLGLTQAALEAQLGVGAGTVGRWERGTVLQGATADRLMRILWAHPELMPELGYVAREGRGPYGKRK